MQYNNVELNYSDLQLILLPNKRHNVFLGLAEILEISLSYHKALEY